ncbi:hypothetical protein [Bradyrhizobium sp. UNPF46]|uniref:hypothetical protein n=1 Tax=Bradyrhizobium sp. UNPF46 TaxID=1141168 RepID=UPI0011534E53|nr:hypothetical protein [Bradyrhizobium sp. UNPF46]
MSTRALACVVARIVVLPQATRNVDLLTEKNSRRCWKSQVARKGLDHAERRRDDGRLDSLRDLTTKRFGWRVDRI